MKKRRKGMVLFSLLACIAVLSLLLYSYISYGDFSQAIEEKTKTNNLVIIDRFLYQWRSANAGEFPASLAEMNFIGLNIDLTGYVYTVTSTRDKYTLTITFDDSRTVTSPGSGP